MLDVDGTLMRTDKTISRKTIDEIVKIQEKGICVAIASGRCTAGIMPTARKIRLDEFGGYIVSYNGACISNAKTGEVIYNINLPDGIVPEIYEFSKREKTGIMTYHDNDIIAENDADQYIQIDAKGCDIYLQDTSLLFQNLPLHEYQCHIPWHTKYWCWMWTGR